MLGCSVVCLFTFLPSGLLDYAPKVCVYRYIYIYVCIYKLPPRGYSTAFIVEFPARSLDEPAWFVPGQSQHGGLGFPGVPTLDMSHGKDSLKEDCMGII